MKYTKEERLEIGRQIYNGELSKYEASSKYGISMCGARDYMRLYRDANGLPPRNVQMKKPPMDVNAMSIEELIDALVRARIREARLKKSYPAEKAGAEKVLPDKKHSG